MTRLLTRLTWLAIGAGTYASTWGWLEFLRHDRMGPSLADGLPLYENAGHDAVGLAPALVVWLLAAFAALLPWRPRRPRLAGTVTILTVFAATTVVTGVQLALVRQSVLGPDLSAAVHTASPWLAAVTTAVAAAALWRSSLPQAERSGGAPGVIGRRGHRFHRGRGAAL